MKGYIIIVEDFSMVSDLLKKALSDYLVDVAQRGEDAVKYALVTRPALVICDMALGRDSTFTGAETIRVMRAISPTSKILALSGHPAMRGEALSVGADKWLDKPFKPGELQRVVEGLING
jgi:DNA-binding response OmpR family regulator